MVQSARQTRTRRRQAAPLPVVAAVFGLPMSGSSSAIDVLIDASETEMVKLAGLDEKEVNEALKEGAQVVFLDPFVPSVENVQKLYDMTLFQPADRILVRFWSPDEVLVKRAEVNDRKDVTLEALDELRQDLLPVEEHIRRLSLDYYMIPNEGDFAYAIANLARRVGVIEK